MTFGFNPYMARVAGEAFGEPCTPNCETCGRDEYACWCEPEACEEEFQILLKLSKQRVHGLGGVE